jgi:DNA-binding Lrp family transcriptional regulator
MEAQAGAKNARAAVSGGGDTAESIFLSQRRRNMIYAYVLIEAEPSRVQDLIEELRDMKLDDSVIKQVHAVTGRYDLIAFVESPDLPSLGN